MLVNEKKAFNLCVVAYTLLWHSQYIPQAQLAGKICPMLDIHAQCVYSNMQ